MNAVTDWRSREIERLRAEVEGLREENAGLRKELVEARRIPILDVPTVVGVGLLFMLAALQTCEWKWKSAAPDNNTSGERGAVSAPATPGTGPAAGMSGPQGPA